MAAPIVARVDVLGGDLDRLALGDVVHGRLLTLFRHPEVRPPTSPGEPGRMIGHWAATCSLFTVGLMGAFVYIVRCSDDSFYVGSATGNDLNRRSAEHRTGAFPGYTSPNQYG